MRITKEQLKQIIKEELEAVIEKAFVGAVTEPYAKYVGSKVFYDMDEKAKNTAMDRLAGFEKDEDYEYDEEDQELYVMNKKAIEEVGMALASSGTRYSSRDHGQHYATDRIKE